MKAALLVCLLLAPTVEAQSHRKTILRTIEHVALGASVQVGVSYAAGGPQKWPVGLLAVGLVAGFKEGSDARSGADSKKQAAIHATTIMLGAGVAVAVKH